MYYARRNGVLAECKTWGGGGLRKDGAIGVAEGGRRTGEGRGSMCVTCVAAITQSRGWLPGNAFQPPHTHTTLDQPQNPLLSLPYFTSWRTISFFWLSNTTSMPHCSTTFNADFNSRHCDRHSLSFSSFWSFSQRFFLLMDYFRILSVSRFSSPSLSSFRKTNRSFLFYFFRKKIFHYFSFLSLFRFGNLLIALSFSFSSVFFSWDDDVSIAPLFVWIFSLLENSSIL